MRTYRIAFTECVEKKQKETGGTGGFRITFDGNTVLKFSPPRESASLDLSEMPQFKVPHQTIADAAGAVTADGGILALASLFALAGAFAEFLRYDVR